MKRTKMERIKALEQEKLELSRKLYARNRQLDYAETAVRDRNDKIKELQEQLDYFKNEYAKVVWNTDVYATFYERVKALVETFDDEKDKPKVITVDLSSQLDPQFVDNCSVIASIVDKIVSEDNV